jgi:hypothetical protein
VASLGFAGDNGSLSDINATQGEFREQIAALNDLMRQIAGNAAVSTGDSAQADPLNAPFTLYVNPYTGSDEFVGGAYNSFESGATQQQIIDSKLKRLEKQRLTCGFTPQRPFRTINRAVIEAAIITSKDWYTITDPAAHVDCVSIVLAPGVHTLYNDPGSGSTSLTSWGLSKSPTTAELIQFNPSSGGGVLLPRGCSLCGADLRKVTIRPNWVPANEDETANYSNRCGMLKITGTGYFFGFTIMDKVGEARSHHLLDGFHFASKTELDAFYAKTLSAVGDGADLASALTVTRGTEYQIVGPIDQTQSPVPAWDTTSSASPYIFNCSVRSNYGLGGAFMDGAKVSGLRSMVCANFTGVSLQKDMSCWQRYSAGGWTTTTYEQYIAADPDDIRMRPERVSRHISAINDAFIQEVSIFAIGQGIHHFTDLGGEITITNSNSSFGGCAAISKGYKNVSFPSDRNWTIRNIKVPLNVSEKTGNIRQIYLGVTESVTSGQITLTTDLAADSTSSTVPAVLLRDGYSLANGTKIWIENPSGDPWHTTLTSAAWNDDAPDKINITGLPTGNDSTTDPDGVSLLLGKRVYVRRLVDTRTPEERRVSILMNNTATVRLPQRNFILQTDPARTNGAIARTLVAGGSEVFAVSNVGSVPTSGGGIATSSEITLRRSAPTVSYANGTFYPAGTIVRHANKHYQALNDVTTSTAAPDAAVFGETYVHMPSDYNAEDPISQEARILSFDTDTDTDPYSQTLGINFSTIWTSAGSTRERYRSSTDYKGIHALLVALGLTSDQAHTALVPKATSGRLLDPASSVDFPTAPTGGAATGRGYWAVEFRRPSVLRLYGHAWEWAGYLNYTKAVPAAQKDLGPQNKFTYYFTSAGGGRVVPQGSNEDGFNVSPRGLEDVETGATLTVESLGASSVDDYQQTQFPALSVDELSVKNINISGNITGLPDVGRAATDTLGPTYLASIERLNSLAAATSNNQINANPYAVTVEGLNYWKNNNRLVSAPVGVQYIYVDPATTNDPSYEQMLAGTPPSSPATRVRNLQTAVSYANTIYGPTATVEYRIAPGIYELKGATVFTTNAAVRAWNMTTNTALNDDREGGTIPFLGGSAETFSNYLDPTKQPIFLTWMRGDFDDTPFRKYVLTFASPFQLRFKEQGTVIGIAWWGATETITGGFASTLANAQARVSDNFFTDARIPLANVPSAFRQSAVSNPDDAFDYFQRACAIRVTSADSNGYYRLYGHRHTSAVVFERVGRIYNCAFGAVSPADDAVAGGEIQFHSMIEVGQESVELNGLRFFGNVRMSSKLNSGTVDLSSEGLGVRDYANIRMRDAGAISFATQNYLMTGHAITFIAPEATNNTNGTVEVGFGTIANFNSNGNTENNNPWSNFSLVSSNYSGGTVSYAIATSTAAASDTSWKAAGPAFHAFFNVAAGITPGLFRNWLQFALDSDINGEANRTADSAGFDGKFGNYARTYSSSTTSSTYYSKGSLFAIFTAVDLDRNSVFGDTPSTWFSVAGGDRDEDGLGVPNVTTYTSGLSAGGMGQNNDPTSSTGLFAALNIKLRGFKKGIDTTNANVIRLDMVL